MNSTAVLADAGLPATARALPGRVWVALACGTLGAGTLWQGASYIREAGPYQPSSGIGYLLGLVGGSLMLLLLLYSLRKRFRILHFLGALKHWFKFHMLAGMLGPALVVLHSAFHVRSFNAAIALYSMLLVVASGVVGRFLYRKVHQGLYGSRAALQDLRSGLTQQMAALSGVFARYPRIAEEVGRFMASLENKPASRCDAIWQFLVLGVQRVRVGAKIQRILREIEVDSSHAVQRSELEAMAQALRGALAEAQRVAQFYGYERLFSMWHAVHIPFLWMLLITSIAHVVAVHAY